MHSPDDIQYALETTRVLREPDRRIETFGETRFEFQIISELMGKNLAFLQYGFQFRRGQIHEEIIHDSMDAVRERVLEDIRRTGNPTRAIIEGVDDAWEVSILKFSFDMIIRSHEINAFDFKRRGLL